MPPRRPIAVAITGGIGAGKTEALHAFARHGAPTLSSDDVVHRLLRDDADVRRAVVERFGDRVMDDAGRLDRKAIAGVVFGEREELEWLESVLHPRVAQESIAWIDALAALDDPPDLCAIEVPLLYETGAEARFDAVVVVTAPEALRKSRARTSVDDRSRRLLPDEDKVKRADFAYVNDGTLVELDRFVSGVIGKLTGSG